MSIVSEYQPELTLYNVKINLEMFLPEIFQKNFYNHQKEGTIQDRTNMDKI